MDGERRVRRTRALAAALPPSPEWEAWLAASGELAPDFGRLRARTGLWSPAQGLKDARGWPARRAAIRARWRRWVIGSMPGPPADLAVRSLGERREGAARVRDLELSMAQGAARLRVRLVLPEGGEPPPVLLTQANHARWGEAAVRRGWAACLVSAHDRDDDSDSFAAAYPGHDWSRLARRGWALSRALDALERLPEVAADRVVVAGHSRNGKAALIAAGDDARFAGVVSSSSGVMGAIPARLCCDRHFGEGVELLTRRYPDWYHPRLRFFSGREHLLPTDAHELLALVAPTPVLLSVAVNDNVESTWAAEQAHATVCDVYDLLGAPGGLTLSWREGGHALSAQGHERHLDWCDAVVGRSPERPLPAPRLHPNAWTPWPRAAVAPAPGWRARPPAELRRAVRATLGAGERGPVTLRRVGLERADAGALLEEAAPPEGVEALRLTGAEGLPIDVFLPADRTAGSLLPLVLWLPPLCRATGYLAGYEQATPLLELLARDGWAVACHDPIGTGSRVREEAELARRYPGWSPLGRMVRDARTVLDAAARLPDVGADDAWLVGYGAGALVALHAAALEPRVAGVAAVAPSAGDPLLLPTGDGGPPYALADLLAALGRRPGLVLSPRWDPEARPREVAAAVRAATASGATVEHRTVADYHRLSAETRATVCAWLREAAAAEPLPEAA
jgi:dienelactone hydrolase